jgi:hypothetical protein
VDKLEPSVELVAFNHFFDQDLAALDEGLGRDEVMVSIPYQRLHKVARTVFPPAAFAGIDAAYRPEFTDRWPPYEHLAHRFAEWLTAAYEPSAFVVPNDGFFYLRPVIERLIELAIPTVTVQKETTIAPLTMEEHSQAVRRSTAPIAEVMTVCSERHREYALRSGAPPDKVIVTGQPRFDVYGRARAAGRHRHDSGGMPMLLYLSFDDLAYLPADAERRGIGTWRTLRRDVESVLGRMATEGCWRIVAKTHPQQLALDDDLGPDVVRSPRGTDVRRLIVEADAVLGFQTTGLFEAAVAGRPVIYTAWGETYEETRELLIPFHEHPEMAYHVRDPRALEALLRRGIDGLDRPGPAALRTAEHHLGPVDGRATERVLDIVRAVAGSGPSGPPPPVPSSTLRRASVRAAGAPLARAVAAGCALVGQDALAGGIRRNAGYWAQEGDEAGRIRRRRRRATTSTPR